MIYGLALLSDFPANAQIWRYTIVPYPTAFQRFWGGGIKRALDSQAFLLVNKQVGLEMTDVFCNSFTYHVSNLDLPLLSIRQPIWDLHIDAFRHIEIAFGSEIDFYNRNEPDLNISPTDHVQQNAQLMDIWMAKLERVRPCRLQSLTIDFTNVFCHNGCCRMVYHAVNNMADWCTELVKLSSPISVPHDPFKPAARQDASQNKAHYAGAPFVTVLSLRGEEEELFIHSHGLRCEHCYLTGMDSKEWYCSRYIRSAVPPISAPQYLPPAQVPQRDRSVTP